MSEKQICGRGRVSRVAAGGGHLQRRPALPTAAGIGGGTYIDPTELTEEEEHEHERGIAIWEVASLSLVPGSQAIRAKPRAEP